MRGAPTFPVEVRSPEDYGPKAESTLARKRIDYFEAGTLAVWDINLKLETVTLYISQQSTVIFHRGDVAHAEPALSEKSLDVDEIFAWLHRNADEHVVAGMGTDGEAEPAEDIERGEHQPC